MVIVCGIDGSANSREAARAAAALARRERDGLLLVHVQEALVFTPPLMDQPVALTNTTQLDLELERARKDLAREGQRLARFGIEVATQVRTGLPDHELIAVAKAEGAQRIVVGSLGRRASTPWRFGSVADRLSQSSPVGLLVVRDARPFERWALEDAPLRILLALGSGQPTAAAVRAVEALVLRGPCELTLAHVYDPFHEARRLSLSDPSSAESRSTIESTLAREFARRFAPGLAPERRRFVAVPARGHVAETLAELAAKEHADLVVLGSHGFGAVHRRLLGSVSYELVALLETNALVLPAEAASKTPADRPPERVRSVLVASDRGPTGQRGLGFALALLPEGGRLVLLHVDVPPTSPAEAWSSYQPIPLPTAEERRESRERIRAELEQDLPAARRGLEFEVEVLEASDVAQAIVGAAERHDVDLICLGTHRHGRMASALLGSIARVVARLSPRPVLLVPPPAQV